MAYLKYFPKPVLDDLVHGRWLPVIGAGMSLNARTPSGKKLPTWPQLGTALEVDLKDFAPNNPIDAISAYEQQFGRARLIEKLFDILLVREAIPGESHREFCALPFQIVCTTNFEFLLEDQYKMTPRAIYPVIGEDQLSLTPPESVTVLLKIHGDLHHPERIVATEGDYDGFLTKYPLLATYLSNQLITKTAVLIGYSLDDPDFRQLWQVVTHRLGRSRRPAYTLMVGASGSDIARFERRGVHVINIPGRKARYDEILASIFRELREYWLPGIIGVSAVKEEKPLRELKLPFDSGSRLCYFSLPVEMLSSYRDKVFPAVEAAGFVPVTADDVVSPGDSVAAKIEALMGRATAVVVEPSTPSTRSELYRALGRMRSRRRGRDALFRLIVVGAVQAIMTTDMAGIEVLVRSENWLDEPDQFVSELVRSLQLAVPDGEPSRGNEAERLLNAHEYTAAVISAMSHLEATLRQRLDKLPLDEVRRPMSLRTLADRAVEHGALKWEDCAFVMDWIPLRNSVVHTGVRATREQATAVVEGVRRILGENQL